MNERPSAIAVGMFDGVHIGHRALLVRTATLARECGLRSVAYSFTNHPRSVFATAPNMLMTALEREEAILSTGIEFVCMEEFTKETAALSPQGFISGLISRFGMKLMLAGFNYTFGCHGEGTTDTMKSFGAIYGYNTSVEPPVEYQGEPVSSTRIRACILGGDMRLANTMLGSYYTLFGNVVRNKNIGEGIGFPTANIDPPENKALPKSGVYATIAMVERQKRAAVTNIGNNPTVNGDKTTIETHILDYSGDLYGKRISIEFIDYLRGECLFSGKRELVRQIDKDARKAAQICGYILKNG